MSDYSGILSYEPERVAALRSLTITALEQVRDVLVDLNGTQEARISTAHLRHVLEDHWLSFLNTLWNSNAMSEWRRTTADTVSVDVPQRNGGAVPALLDAGMRPVTLDAGGHRAMERIEANLLGSLLDGVIAVDSESVARLQRYAATAQHYGYRPSLTPEQLAALLAVLEVLIEAWLRGDPNVSDDLIDQMGFLIGGALDDPSQYQEEIAASLGRSDALLVLVNNNSGHFSDAAYATITTYALAQSSTGNHRRVSYPGALLGLITGSTATPSRTRAVAEHLATSPEAIRALVTHGDLDQSEVEQVVVDLLTSDPAQGLHLLSGISAAATTANFHNAARRGIAQGLGPLLPYVASTLDHRLPVIAVIDGVSITISSYQELAALTLQIIDDLDASRYLAITAANYRNDSLGRAAARVEAESDLHFGEGAVLLASELDGSVRFIELINYSAEVDAAASAQQIERNRRLAGNVIDMAAALGSSLPGAGGAIAGTTLAASKIGVDALLDRPVDILDPLAGDDLWACRALHGIVLLPLIRPSLRAPLGLDRVPQQIWTDLATLISRFDTEPENRAHLHANIQAIISSNPSLQIYVTQVTNLSGDARLATPPSVPGHATR